MNDHLSDVRTQFNEPGNILEQGGGEVLDTLKLIHGALTAPKGHAAPPRPLVEQRPALRR